MTLWNPAVSPRKIGHWWFLQSESGDSSHIYPEEYDHTRNIQIGEEVLPCFETHQPHDTPGLIHIECHGSLALVAGFDGPQSQAADFYDVLSRTKRVR